MVNNPEVSEIITALNSLKTAEDQQCFLMQLLTPSELKSLQQRWNIVKRLLQNHTQREIAKELKTSLCKITRGSKELRKKKSPLKEAAKKLLKL